MGRTFSWVTALVIVNLGLACPSFAATNARTLSRQVLSENSVESAAAIAELRRLGPEGLRTFLDVHADRLPLDRVKSAAEVSSLATADWQRFSAVLDALCQQRDCYASQLYWYTDLEAAKVAAKATGKPILSLRLLGGLDEEFSCANSRFFRVALYANREISSVLRDRVILHWQSVRPVPKVTIDFGDGRQLQRTLTGNSIHYLLDAEGRPLDALPGLYGPKAFLSWVERAAAVAQQTTDLSAIERAGVLEQYHRDRIAAIETRWMADLGTLGIPAPVGLRTPADLNETDSAAPLAERAAQLAVTKSVVERPILSSISPRPRTSQRLSAITDAAVWQQIATLHLDDARLDRNSQILLQRKNPYLLRGSDSRSETTTAQLRQLQQNFERAIALDTVRNEYLLHQQLHQWFVEDTESTANTDRLNERVYSELFLTPSSDPWLGLLPAGTYTGIENGGVSQ